jgi:hypothetical protein
MPGWYEDETQVRASLGNVAHLGSAQTGWYALDVAEYPAGRGLVEIEFVADSNGRRERVALRESGTGGKQVAWIHIGEPGSVIVRASGAAPALRGMDYAEFVSRSRDVTLSKALLTVFLLEEVVPLTAWILIVWGIRAFAYKRIGSLPRTVRTHARREVDLMLNFAKWAGVGCYLIWTINDITCGRGSGSG